MKLADNLDRHIISDEFEFRPDRTIVFGVACPLVPINPIFNLFRSIACLVLIETLWNLQIIWTCIYSRTSSNLGRTGLFTLDLLALLVPINPIFDLVRSITCSVLIAHLVLIGSFWELQIIWTGIRSWTSSNSSKMGLFTLELLALVCQQTPHLTLYGA